MGERVQPTVQQLVAERLGQTNGRVKKREDLTALVHGLSAMLAHKMVGYSAPVVGEAGNVMMALMERHGRAFTIEMLMPWARNIALVEPPERSTTLSRATEDDLAARGFCLSTASDCLSRVFEYTLEESADGLPDVVSRFWRTLALAAPPFKPGKPAHNVPPLSAWISAQAHHVKTERGKQTCLALALFIKGLAVKRREEVEHEAAKQKHDAAVAMHRRKSLAAQRMGNAAPPPPAPMTNARTGSPLRGEKQAKAIVQLQQAARQRREKSTRTLVEAELQADAELHAAMVAHAAANAADTGRSQTGGAAAPGAALAKMGKGSGWSCARAGQDAASLRESGADARGASVEHRGAEMKIKDGADDDQRVGVRRVPVQGLPPLNLGEKLRPPRKPEQQGGAGQNIQVGKGWAPK